MLCSLFVAGWCGLDMNIELLRLKKKKAACFTPPFRQGHHRDSGNVYIL